MPLFNSSFINGSSVSLTQAWAGGRSALVVSAIAYTAGGLQLQTQGMSSAGGTSGGAWINIGSSIVSNQVYPFDAPRGNYRLVNQVASSVIGIDAVLVTIPYM